MDSIDAAIMLETVFDNMPEPASPLPPPTHTTPAEARNIWKEEKKKEKEKDQREVEKMCVLHFGDSCRSLSPEQPGELLQPAANSQQRSLSDDLDELFGPCILGHSINFRAAIAAEAQARAKKRALVHRIREADTVAEAMLIIASQPLPKKSRRFARRMGHHS